ncbi:VOC family protein [Streptomyces sp. SL13]|uniref:VOC family protein n=1 Tax=Streptantibioticus silvisoli TaxID=2705255 RepID=A0AA90K064_9ACTN|nr:VOC family protein [Streptantibioticus silvisoli]MDI5966154.1 VOC family protein [Streptantibioticus silvisoli]MDI5972776.1 VOC family protein [Streptantibioticus silvisoli]
MSVELNHTIVQSLDKRESAEFLSRILGLAAGAAWGPFIPMTTGNGVTLDFATVPAASITLQHYAFLVSDEEFDASFQRIQDAGVDYWADPHGRQPGEINHLFGGRGVYFKDPSGHGMEIITRPYGGQAPDFGTAG